MRSNREKNDYSERKESLKKVMSVLSRKATNKNQDPEARCYNCGAKGHKSKNCKKRDLGIKCFKCQQFL